MSTFYYIHMRYLTINQIRYFLDTIYQNRIYAQLRRLIEVLQRPFLGLKRVYRISVFLKNRYQRLCHIKFQDKARMFHGVLCQETGILSQAKKNNVIDCNKTCVDILYRLSKTSRMYLKND